MNHTFRLLATCLVFASALSAGAGEPSVFERQGAAFNVSNGKVKYLKKGCTLYSDKDWEMKERPKQLSNTRYVLAPFSGCTVECTQSGVAFALGLFDVHNANQTKRVEEYLKKNNWQQVAEIPEFILFYTNGADRKGRAFWKVIKKGERLTFPNGTILCYRYRT